MLVLTRKPGEAILIGDDVRITVVDLGQGRVKIGIEAPSSVKVDREEVRERKQLEEVAAPSVLPVPMPQLHNRIAAKLPPADDDARTIVPFPPRKSR